MWCARASKPAPRPRRCGPPSTPSARSRRRAARPDWARCSGSPGAPRVEAGRHSVRVAALPGRGARQDAVNDAFIGAAARGASVVVMCPITTVKAPKAHVGAPVPELGRRWRRSCGPRARGAFVRHAASVTDERVKSGVHYPSWRLTRRTRLRRRLDAEPRGGHARVDGGDGRDGAPGELPVSRGRNLPMTRRGPRARHCRAPRGARPNAAPDDAHRARRTGQGQALTRVPRRGPQRRSPCGGARCRGRGQARAEAEADPVRA